MPTKRLPQNLVARLRKYVKAGALVPDALGRMKNIDGRRDHWRIVLESQNFQDDWKRAKFPGSRVRQMNISRHYPKNKSGKPSLELVLKRVDDRNAREVLVWVKKTVKDFNRKNKERGIRILEPNAYPIGNEIIAMAKSHCPTAGILLKDPLLREGGTAFWQRLKKQDEQLWWAVKNEQHRGHYDALLTHIFQETGWGPDDLLLVECRSREVLFMALPDKPHPNPNFL